jgi:hypothetical protein
MTTKITDANITTRTIAANKIGSKVVTTDELANNAVTSNEINDGAIVNADVSPSAAISSSKLSGVATSSDLNAVKDNIGLLGFKMAVNESLTVFNLIDGVVDEFQDESGTDEGAGSNDRYNATNDYYINSTQDDGQSSPMASFSAGFSFNNGSGSVTEPDTSTAQAVHPQSFNPLGNDYSDGQFAVDPGLSSINIKAWGSGGRGPYNQPNFMRGTGGGGGYVTGDLAVTGGQTIFVGTAVDNETTNPSLVLLGPSVPWPNATPMNLEHPRSGRYQYFPESANGGGWGQRITRQGHFGGGGAMSYISIGPSEIDWENTANTFALTTNSTPQVAGAAPPYSPQGQRMNYLPIAPQIALVAGGGGGGNGSEPSGTPPFTGGAGGGLTGEASEAGEQTTYGPGGGGGGDQEQAGDKNPGNGGGADGNEPERFMFTDQYGAGMGWYPGGGAGGQQGSHGYWAGGGGSSYYGHPQVSNGSTTAGSGSSVANSGDPSYQPGIGNGTNYWNTTQAGYVFISGQGFNAASATSTDVVSQPFTAASVPTTARIVVFEENIDTPTLNTDVVAKVSRDGGSNYSTATLSDSGYVTGSSGQRILTGSVDISGQPSGSSMRWKLELRNNAVKIHGVSLQWA